MLADLALAEAQQLALVKGERRALSPNTLVKLHNGIVYKFEICRQKLKVSKRDYEEFAASFKAFIEDGMKCWEALMLKKFGTLSYDAGYGFITDIFFIFGSQNGLAVACITQAYNNLVDIQSSDYLPWRKMASDNISTTNDLVASYVKINVPIFHCAFN